jgi:hypothetical protein
MGPNSAKIPRSRHRLFNNLQVPSPSATAPPKLKRDFSALSKNVISSDRRKFVADALRRTAGQRHRRFVLSARRFGVFGLPQFAPAIEPATSTRSESWRKCSAAERSAGPSNFSVPPVARARRICGSPAVETELVGIMIVDLKRVSSGNEPFHRFSRLFPAPVAGVMATDTTGLKTQSQPFRYTFLFFKGVRAEGDPGDAGHQILVQGVCCGEKSAGKSLRGKGG